MRNQACWPQVKGGGLVLGPKLVEMETTGTQVVKRRFTVTGNGDTMDLQNYLLVPDGQAETTHFKRAPSEAPQEEIAPDEARAFLGA